MIYQVIWLKKADKQFNKLQPNARKQIYTAVTTLSNSDNWNNVKKLVNHKYDYRLRVGDYRVLFNGGVEIEIVSIEELKKRDDRTY